MAGLFKTTKLQTVVDEEARARAAETILHAQMQNLSLAHLQNQAMLNMAASIYYPSQSLAVLQAGGLNGIGQSATQAYGGANASSGISAGAGQIAYANYSKAHITAIYAAQAFADPPRPLERAGVTVGELIGWRIWRVREKDRLLESYSAERIWLPGETMSGEPAERGDSGVWAFKSQGDGEAKMMAAMGLSCNGFTKRAGVWAFGSAYLWGEVIEHERGWRAEFAEVRSLDVTSDCANRDYVLDRLVGAGELRAALRTRYRVGSDDDARAAEAGKAAEPDAYTE